MRANTTMDDVTELAGELAGELQLLIDDRAPATEQTIDMSEAHTLDSARFLLGRYFERKPAVPAVTVVLGGRRVGVVTRERLQGIGDVTAASPEVGAGERIQLPGDSTRYRLLEFVCMQCPATAYRVYYDQRDLPFCAHGLMELRR